MLPLGSVYGEVKQQFQFFAYVNYLSGTKFQPYVYFQAFDDLFPKKKLQKKLIIM